MAKIYARKIRQLVDDGKLPRDKVADYIEANVPETWKAAVRELLSDLID